MLRGSSGISAGSPEYSFAERYMSKGCPSGGGGGLKGLANTIVQKEWSAGKDFLEL
jgi:hypothetical protein